MVQAVQPIQTFIYKGYSLYRFCFGNGTSGTDSIFRAVYFFWQRENGRILKGIIPLGTKKPRKGA